ncbi:hypothetical protein ACFSCZ_14880 [Siminovitchia sediminis]|uniref:Uncharacterized protein n=2 Tax=Siminovitchia sediminis TaxID=1274353 RepID=A0ABW4KJA6_9BACI
MKEKGYKQGYEVEEMEVPADLSDDAKAAFEEGYQEGLKKRQEEVTQEGFDAAFKKETYELPDTYDEGSKQEDWFKKGFESNTEAAPLREEAFQQGKAGKKMTIPEEWAENEAAAAMFERHYVKGKEERAERNRLLIMGGIAAAAVVVVVVWVLVRREK